MAQTELFTQLPTGTAVALTDIIPYVRNPLSSPTDMQLPVSVLKSQFDNYYAASGTGGLADAPSDGKTYGRKNAAWSEVNATITGSNSGGVYAKIFKTQQTVPSGTSVQVMLDTLDTVAPNPDSYGFYVSTGTFTVPAGMSGMYGVYFNTYWATTSNSNPNIERFIDIEVNGAMKTNSLIHSITGSAYQGQTAYMSRWLNAGDTVTFLAESKGGIDEVLFQPTAFIFGIGQMSTGTVPVLDGYVTGSWTQLQGRFAASGTVYGSIPTAMEGLEITWSHTSGTSVGQGHCWAQNGNEINVTSALTTVHTGLSASTWYHGYVYLSGGAPAVEWVTTAPVAWRGTAYSKTGDTSRRYIGSIKTNGSGGIYNFLHNAPTGKIQWREQCDSSPFRAVIVTVAWPTTETAGDLSGVCPVTSRIAQVRLINTTDQNMFFGTSDDSASGPPSGGIAAINSTAAGGTTSQGFVDFPMNSSQAITYWWGVGPGGGSGIVDVYGYYFKR